MTRHTPTSCYTASMAKSLQHMRDIALRIGMLLCAIYIVSSIIMGQVGAPLHFSHVGTDRQTLTTFLRAVVASGDRYLIRDVFSRSLRTQYPVVFDSYLREDDWKRTLDEIRVRSPDSPPILWALAELADRSGQTAEAQSLRERARAIDPRLSTHK